MNNEPLLKIYSDRHFQNWPSQHIVYEWEDEIAKSLKIPILESPFQNNYITKIVSRIWKNAFKNDLTGGLDGINCRKGNFLYFEMTPKKFRSFSNNRNAIPIIIDYWERENVEYLNHYYRKCQFILISSLEVLNFLKKNNCNLNLMHFPLSLPDKYHLEPSQIFKKHYDIVLAGRTNPVLWEYLKKYEHMHPEIEYLYQEQQNGELYYRSNKHGIIGNFHRREEYINLIRSAKISFYSTPGIDGGEKRTGGFNPLTPRFLELLSAGCHVIARYVHNEESEFFQLESICPSVNSYEEFEKQMNFALNSKDQPIKRNSDYLLKHYTSMRIDTLKKVINTI